MVCLILNLKLYENFTQQIIEEHGDEVLENYLSLMKGFVY